MKFEQYRLFLRRVIYAGLKDLNTGFDSASIGHFSPEDFLIVSGDYVSKSKKSSMSRNSH